MAKLWNYKVDSMEHKRKKQTEKERAIQILINLKIFERMSQDISGNFSIRFGDNMCRSLLASIATIVSLLLTSDRKSSHW